jgi:hypothetical protein
MGLREALRLAGLWGSSTGDGWREILYHLKNYVDLLESREKFYRKRIDDLEDLNNRLHGDVAFLSQGAVNDIREQNKTIQKRIQPAES